jgi:serine/threonine protein kinase
MGVPANLLLEHGGERVRITDFGLARVVDDATLTTSGAILGTPHYMSPEQARGEPVDHRTDLFSLAEYYPRWLALMLGRGEAYLLKGDLDRALADSDEAVRFAPRSAEARLLRARVHGKRGKPDLAAADRRAAAQLKPDPILTLPELRS